MEPIHNDDEVYSSQYGRDTAQPLTSQRECCANEPSSTEVQALNRESSTGEGVPDSDDLIPREQEVIQTTRYRFLIVILFAAFGFINQLQCVAFATVIREVQAYFSVDAFLVNVLSLQISIVYVIGVIPGCYVYNRVGLRYGMIIGAGVNAFASVLKLIAVWAPQYPLLVVAQVFVALGQILYLSLPTLIAGIWFPAHERTVATAVASLMGYAGMATGMFYSPHVVSLPDTNTRKEWGGLMGSQFGLSVLVFILIVIFARDKPKHRPSQTSTEDYKLPLGRFLKTQLCDLNFMLLTVAFGLIVGSLTAVAGVLAQLLEPFGIKEEESGILAFAGIVSGAINCGIVGYIVDRTHYYKYTAIALASVSTTLFLTATILSKTMTDKQALIIALYIIVPLLEFFVLPLAPVVLELAVELAYPCPETVPSTLALAIMSIFAFVGMIVFSVILGDHPTVDTSFYCFLITLGVSVLGIVGLIFVKENLQRRAEDQALDFAAEDAEEEVVTEEKEGEEDVKGTAQLCVRTGIAASPVSER